MLYHKDWAEKELAVGALVLSLFFYKDSSKRDNCHLTIKKMNMEADRYNTKRFLRMISGAENFFIAV